MDVMKIKTLKSVNDDDRALKYPVSVCFNKADEARWCDLRDRLRRLNYRYRIANYARPVLLAMMDDLEKLVKEEESQQRYIDFAG